MREIICCSTFILCFSVSIQAQQPRAASTNIHQNLKPAETQRPAAGPVASSHFNGNERTAVFPIPRRMYLHSNSRNLVMVAGNISRNLMDYTTTRGGAAGSLHPEERSRMTQAGVMGVVSKNIAGQKTGFVLTNNTSSWQPGANFSKAAKPAKLPPDDPSWNCVVSDETLTAQSSSFLNASRNEQGLHLYPGAIYTFDDYATGNYRPFENGRNPIEIVTDVNKGSVSLPVQSPNQPTIRQAIANIVSQFTAAPGGATQIQQLLYTNNLSEFSIAVAAGGAYDGYSGSDFFSHNQAEQHIYVTVDCIKTLYTMSVHRPANGYFANGQMPQTTSPLVMIQDVTYGARLLANLDIKISSKTDLNKFHFQYDAPTANAQFDLNSMTHDSTATYTINSYMVGVPASTGIIRTYQDFQQQIDNIFSQCNYRTALPIAYTLTDMDGNYLGIESMTDHFPVRQCTPANEIFTLESAYLTLQTGSDNKNGNSSVDVLVIAKGNNNGNTLGSFSDNSTEFKSASTMTFPIRFIKNQYHPNDYTMDEFSNGGQVMFKFTYAVDPFITGDNWDIANAHVILNFRSQKGTPQQISVQIPAFRLSAGNGGPAEDDHSFYFDASGNIIQ